jgi:hypothetical protein
MTEAAGALPSTPLRRVPPHELPGAGPLTYVLRQRFSYTYDAPVRDLDHRLVVVPPRRHGNQRRRRHSITVSAADARTTHRRDAAGNLVTRSRVPLVQDMVEFVVDVVVERVGPGTDVLVPAAALTDSRLLRPTRLTAADTAIRRLAATMADQDTLATADRFCGYVHEALRCPDLYRAEIQALPTPEPAQLPGTDRRGHLRHQHRLHHLLPGRPQPRRRPPGPGWQDLAGLHGRGARPAPRRPCARARTPARARVPASAGTAAAPA